VARLEKLDLGAIITPGGGSPAVTEALNVSAAELVAEGMAAETRRAYSGDLGPLRAWCSERGLVPIPATAERLVNYVAHLAA